MTKLSPAAQAVLKAGGVDQGWPIHRKAIAAALEAAADQVVPEEREPDVPDFPNSDEIAPYYEWLYRRDIRSDLLTIAAELRGDTTKETP
jgi:hypothetical protein